MKQQNKYTHLIERTSCLLKMLAADTLADLTGMTLSANYWRLREGKGLLSLFDQESLQIWSQICADIRRYTGSPVSLNPANSARLRRERVKLLQRMEKYRTWLEKGAQPTYHHTAYGCACSEKYEREIFERALGAFLKDRGFDFCAPPEKNFWSIPAAKRAEIREQRRGMVTEIIAGNVIEWPAVYALAAELSRKVKEVEDNIERRLKALYKELKEAWLTPEQAEGIQYVIDDLNAEWAADALDPDFPLFFSDEIFQIRTAFDKRSSEDAWIGWRVGWICDVPTISANHREIYNRNRDVLAKFREWKEQQEADLERMKAERCVKYDQQPVVDAVLSALANIRIPKITEQRKPEVYTGVYVKHIGVLDSILNAKLDGTFSIPHEYDDAKKHLEHLQSSTTDAIRTLEIIHRIQEGRKLARQPKKQ